MAGIVEDYSLVSFVALTVKVRWSLKGDRCNGQNESIGRKLWLASTVIFELG